MAIKIENKVFQIETEHTSYQMKVDEYGVLNHLWYGAKTNCCMVTLFTPFLETRFTR